MSGKLIRKPASCVKEIDSRLAQTLAYPRRIGGFGTQENIPVAIDHELMSDGYKKLAAWNSRDRPNNVDRTFVITLCDS